MFTTFLVGIAVARYLGPEKYGLIAYVQSYVGFFIAVANLGIDGIVTRELAQNIERENEILGSSFILKLIGSISMVIICLITSLFLSKDKTTIAYFFIISLSMLFQTFNVIDFFFQAQVKSKYVVYAQITQTILTSAFRIFLVLKQADILYFVIIILFDSIFLAVGFLITYQAKGSRITNWKFSMPFSRKLLSDSWPLLISAITFMIYSRIDQIIMNQTLGSAVLGNYAVAVRLGEAWYVIPAALISTLAPAIFEAKKKNDVLYKRRMQNLYDSVMWSSILIALPLVVFAHPIIQLLFGSQYKDAALLLQIHSWSVVLSAFASATGIWFWAENFQKFSLFRTFTGACTSLILNFSLIPVLGPIGAAVSAICSHFIVSYITLTFSPKVWPNLYIAVNSLNPYKSIKRIIVELRTLNLKPSNL